MPLDYPHLIAIALVLMAGSFIQGAVGFAFGLFAIPALALVGVPLQHAIPVVAGATLVQTSWACRHLREHIQWGQTARVALVRAIFTGIGVWLLAHQLAPNPTLAKQLLGIVLVTIVVVLWTLRIKPRERLHPIWGAIAFPTSGLLGGTFGMGGPPLVLWATAHQWTTHRTRAFLLSNFFAITPIQLAFLLLAFGRPAGQLMLLGLACGPAVLLGSQLGLTAGHRLSPTRLRTVAFILLLIIAINAILAPWLA